MIATKQNDVTFFEQVKLLQNFGDLFDLQATIAEKVKHDGIDVIKTMIEEVIEAITCLPHDIPFIIELLKSIVDYAKTDDALKNRILTVFSKYTINREQERIRRVAIDILAEYHPKQIIPYLLNIARDQTESHVMRIQALQCLRKACAEIDTLSLLLEILERNEEDYMLMVMDVLETHQQSVDVQEIQAMLEQISRRQTISLHIRCRAIELLGVFGDIDLLERMCLLSGKDAKIHDALQRMLQSLLSKPLNILGIRAENFEHLIKEWLIKLGYQQVVVTRAVRDDGVDVIAYKEGHGVRNKLYKVIVQCKRYAKNPIDVEVVEQLVDDISKHQAKEGQLITTSTFSRRAREFAQNHQYIELIDREELQLQLDKVFGDNYYCIGSRHEY